MLSVLTLTLTLTFNELLCIWMLPLSYYIYIYILLLLCVFSCFLRAFIAANDYIRGCLYQFAHKKVIKDGDRPVCTNLKECQNAPSMSSIPLSGYYYDNDNDDYNEEDEYTNLCLSTSCCFLFIYSSPSIFHLPTLSFIISLHP